MSCGPGESDRVIKTKHCALGADRGAEALTVKVKTFSEFTCSLLGLLVRRPWF